MRFVPDHTGLLLAIFHVMDPAPGLPSPGY